MQYSTVDRIVKGVLLNKGYPMHWYLQCLVSARDCLLELHLDDLQVVNTVELTVVKDGMYATLPNDYVDYTLVGVKVGQKIRPLVEVNNLNRLHNYDSSGNIVNYATTETVSNEIIYTYPYGIFWGTTLIDDYGENIGRLYGWGAGNETDTFEIIPERCQIQLNENSCFDKIVLQYISNGMNCDAATQVDVYAERTIKDYIMWDLKRHNRNYSRPDCQYEESLYIKSRKILRARKDEITVTLMKRILQRNYTASPRI